MNHVDGTDNKIAEAVLRYQTKTSEDSHHLTVNESNFTFLSESLLSFEVFQNRSAFRRLQRLLFSYQLNLSSARSKRIFALRISLSEIHSASTLTDNTALCHRKYNREFRTFRAGYHNHTSIKHIPFKLQLRRKQLPKMCQLMSAKQRATEGHIAYSQIITG